MRARSPKKTKGPPRGTSLPLRRKRAEAQKPAGRVQLGRAGLVINALAVLWLAFEATNIAWPRESLAPPDAPVYQVWAAPLVLALIAAVGAAYLFLAKPQRRLEH